MASTQINFHPDFNRDVVPVIFAVDGVGFKVDASVLMGHSKFFSDMLGSSELGLTNEGTTEHPIVIEGTTPLQFANFCAWLNNSALNSVAAPTDEHQLLDVLQVSHLYGVKKGFEFAIKGLSAIDLSPSFRIHLSRRFLFNDWTDTTIRTLIFTPIARLTPDDLTNIGVQIVGFIMVAKERLQDARLRLTNFPIEPRNPLADDAPFCAQHGVCRRVWVERWLMYLARQILPYDSIPIPIDTIPDVLATMDHPKMSPACKAYYIQTVRDVGNLQVKNEIISEAVDKTRTYILA